MEDNSIDLHGDRTYSKKQIGKLLTDGRESLRLTQANVAEYTGISLKTVQRIEAGTSNYTIDNFLDLLRYYDMTITVVDHSRFDDIYKEEDYSVMMKFLIALPFMPIDILYDVLTRIACDFGKNNMSYVRGQLKWATKKTCENEKIKSIVEKEYEATGIESGSNESGEEDGTEFEWILNYITARRDFFVRFLTDELWEVYLNKYHPALFKDKKIESEEQKEYSTKEAGATLNCSAHTVSLLRKYGILRGVKRDDAWYYPKEEIEEVIKKINSGFSVASMIAEKNTGTNTN